MHPELDDDSVEAIRAELDIGATFVKSRVKRVRFEHVRRLMSRVLRRGPAFADEDLSSTRTTSPSTKANQGSGE